MSERRSVTRKRNPDLRPLLLGGGQAVPISDSAMRLTIPCARTYADAQLDDYHGLPRPRFPWSPPLRLSLEARASSSAPKGTLGFGFWNDPFTFSLGQGGAARRLPAAPNAAWFFYASPPSQMELAPGVAGNGWKAATLRAPRLPTILLAPAAAATLALAALPGLGPAVMAAGRRVIRASERLLESELDDWHKYEIIWEKDRVEFNVDGTKVHESRVPPSGPLGFVVWIDNQFAVASRAGKFRFGVVPTESEQWLEVANLAIVPK